MIKMLRAQYPDTWERIAERAKRAANHQCQFCGIAQYTQLISHRGKPYLVYLHACHVRAPGNTKDNPTPELIVLCPRCHFIYDREERERAARVRIERLKHRKLLLVYLMHQF